MPYLSALDVRSRRGAIQIHVYLYLYLNWCTDQAPGGALPVPWTVKKLRRLSDVVFGFYTSDPDYDFEELCNEADHRLFNMILGSQYHVLEQLLPHVLPQSYNLWKRPHSRHIPNRCSYLTDCNFLTRMLFADSYLTVVFSLILCFYYVCITLTFSISVFTCGLTIFNKRILLLLFKTEEVSW